MQLLIGIVLLVVGLLLCLLDLGKRIARRRWHGGVVQAIWGPDEPPALFYIGLALLLGASLLLVGTANP